MISLEILLSAVNRRRSLGLFFQMMGPSAVAVASEALQATGVVEGLDSLLSASATTDATFSALSRITMRWSNEELLLAVQGSQSRGAAPVSFSLLFLSDQ